MKREMSTESALPDQERMLKYKLYAVAFSYPYEEFFKTFPGLTNEKDSLISEYDRLFRAEEIWLYSTEYLAENEFQKSNYLSDIMGFYRAFGLEPTEDRADSLSSEFEFMHYLIVKMRNALKGSDITQSKEKAFICHDAQKKFFAEYIHVAAKKIAEAVIIKTKNYFYRDISEEMLDFLKKEKNFVERKI
jgi:TorA maturation chaperone TorD